MEQADGYSKYLYNRSLDVGEKYICNCTNLASFGKFCEYEFYGGSVSFNDAVTKQFRPLESVEMNIGSQLHGNRPCYTTLTCNSGLMCMDWRHICDGKHDEIGNAFQSVPLISFLGKQLCMEGLDEESCDKLEFNECEDDEYR